MALPRFVSALIAAVVVVSAAACATPTEGESTPRQRNVVPPSATGRQLVVDPSTVDQFAREHFPDEYAGVAVEAGGGIAIYRVPSAQLDEALRREFATTDFDFRDARYSERDLQQLTEEILSETEQWGARGVDIQGAGPDFVRGVVEVLTPDAEAARQLFSARYGNRVTIREGAVAPATR